MGGAAETALFGSSMEAILRLLEYLTPLVSPSPVSWFPLSGILNADSIKCNQRLEYELEMKSFLSFALST